MSGPEIDGFGDLDPAPDVVELLEQCREDALEREGIAMVVALHDLRPGRAAPPPSTADGARLAGLFDHYWAGLAAAGFPAGPDPEAELTGERELVDTLWVLAERHVRAPEDRRAR